jgi:signal recognition particle receptor subunit beta
MTAEAAERREVDARIVYWGIEGSGKSTNLRVIHAKLRPDHRGRLEQIPTRIDPTVVYDRLPIELGEIAGVRTRLHIVAVPGAPEHAPTRKALLDRIDGVVFVVDAQRDRIDENVASLEELRRGLAAYGRSLEHVPLVVQYNKQDRSDPYVLEELHRKLDVRGAAAFEAVAAEGSGVLQTLTTISKRVVRTLRERSAAAAPAATGGAPSRPAATPAPPVPPVGRRAGAPPAAAPIPRRVPVAPRELSRPPASLETEALAAADGPDARDLAVHRAQGLLDASWPEVTASVVAEHEPASDPARRWRVVSAGTAAPAGRRGLVVPLVLADPDGRELRLRLAISLDLTLDE